MADPQVAATKDPTTCNELLEAKRAGEAEKDDWEPGEQLELFPDAGSVLHGQIKAAAARVNPSTGSQRDRRAGKGRCDLLPADALLELAKAFEDGANKYDERNWEKGQPLSWYLDSGMRHALQWAAGYDDEDHLRQWAWNAVAALATAKRITDGLLPEELWDIPPSNMR